MRERQVEYGYSDYSHGITPAYAGKTRIVSLHFTTHRDHPRVCGKDIVPITCLPACMGSPPRMRERLLEYVQSLSRFGITPAYAGKTLKNPNKIVIFPRLNSKNYLLFKAIIIAHDFQLYYYARNFNNPFKLKTRCAVSLASRRALCGTDSEMLYSCSTVFSW